MYYYSGHIFSLLTTVVLCYDLYHCSQFLLIDTATFNTNINTSQFYRNHQPEVESMYTKSTVANGQIRPYSLFLLIDTASLVHLLCCIILLTQILIHVNSTDTTNQKCIQTPQIGQSQMDEDGQPETLYDKQVRYCEYKYY